LDVLVIVLNPVNFLVKNKYTMPSIRPLYVVLLNSRGEESLCSF
jgi:hypothetical protein